MNKFYMNGKLIHKASDHNTKRCEVEKWVFLPHFDFERLKANPYQEHEAITAARDLMYEDKNTALVTDTRCFQTSDTSVQTFETAAALKMLGADTFNISRRNVFVKSRGRRIIEDLLRESLHFSCEDRLITGIITLDDLKTADIADSELEGINSFIEQYEEMLIGVTVRELPDGRSRCSVRTSGDISANDICAVHGGGGHYHASVCEITDNVNAARIIMEETCKRFLKGR